ncbi:MAG: Nif3-like dinuclear metal center hexameric protein [Oscillospiraceae bacterium]|nr:Nif3-like dinuclear metal center hexameric protein [Oscillospiraceae bacterium]
MIYTIKDFYDVIDETANFGDSEDWDNTGILIGNEKNSVNAALIALDATPDVINEAKRINANLIITHHPVIFPYLNSIDSDSTVYRLIASNINLISAHTNFDKSDYGVNSALTKVLGLSGVSVLTSAGSPGLARIGKLENPMQPDEFALFVKEKLNAYSVKYTEGTKISIVAVSGGSGGELWKDSRLAGAQALVTSEVKHHQLLEAKKAGFTLVDAGHYATEVIALPLLCNRLSERLPKAKITVSQSQSDPARYV